MPDRPPLIAITLDSRLEPDDADSPRTYHSGAGYGDAVAAAGGVPLWVGHDLDALPRLLTLCDAFVLTGGGDPDTRALGEPTHPDARLMDPRRQAFELALLDALAAEDFAARPVLGVCLGMQLMCLHAGGKLDQAMVETMGERAADAHRGFRRHLVAAASDAPAVLAPAARWEVVSSHRQRIVDAGRLRVAAAADDGTVEAVFDPARPWRIGVQWHAERTRDASHPLGWGLFAALVRAAERQGRRRG